MDEQRYGPLPVICRCWGLRSVRVHDPYATNYKWGYLYEALEVDGGNSGIPARLDSRIGFGEPVGMKSAGFVEQFKAPIVEMHERTAQRTRKIWSPLPVAVIDLFIHPARIMKNGKKRYYLSVSAVCFGNLKSVLQHPRPMDCSVMPVLR